MKQGIVKNALSTEPSTMSIAAACFSVGTVD